MILDERMLEGPVEFDVGEKPSDSTERGTMEIQCCECRRVRVDGMWISRKDGSRRVSHTYCPVCLCAMRERMGEALAGDSESAETLPHASDNNEGLLALIHSAISASRARSAEYGEIEGNVRVNEMESSCRTDSRVTARGAFTKCFESVKVSKC